MAISSVTLSAAVGRGAPNHRHDVAALQVLLSRVVPNGVGGALWRGPVDGRPSRALEEAIAVLQASEDPNRRGRLAPGAPLLAALATRLPRALRGLRGLRGTAAVFAARPDGPAVASGVSALARDHLIPRGFAADVSGVITRARRDLGLALTVAETGIDREGRFTATLACWRVIWFGPRGEVLPESSPPPRDAAAAILALARPSGGLEPGPAGCLALRSRRGLKSLVNGGPRLNRAKAARLGLAASQGDRVSRQLIAAALDLLERDGERAEFGEIVEALDGPRHLAAVQLSKGGASARPASENPAIQALVAAGHAGWTDDPDRGYKPVLVEAGTGCKVLDARGRPIHDTNVILGFPMTPFTVDEFVEFLRSPDIENFVPHLYKDTGGKITVGIGTYLETIAEAQGLAFFFPKDPSIPVTAKWIESEYNNIRALPIRGHWSKYTPDTTLAMTLAEAKRKAKADALKEIGLINFSTQFPRFDTYPVIAKNTIYDIQYNTRNPKIGGFPNLVASVTKRDWKQAGFEQIRSDAPQRSKVIQRDLAKEAAKQPYFIRFKPCAISLSDLARKHKIGR